MQNSAPNSRKCSKGAQRNRERPNCLWSVSGFSISPISHKGREIWDSCKYVQARFLKPDALEAPSTAKVLLLKETFFVLHQFKYAVFHIKPPSQLGLSRLCSATFEQLLAFGATFCGFSNLEQVLPFRAIFEQNIGLEHISSTKKSTISWKTSIHANFLKAYHVINLLNT